jgi:hypothetical protein
MGNKFADYLGAKIRKIVENLGELDPSVKTLKRLAKHVFCKAFGLKNKTSNKKMTNN